MSRFDRETLNRTNPGDELASGGKSATFLGPRMKFNEGEMRDDLKRLSPEDFILKYMITRREYDLIAKGDEEKVNDFAEEMKRAASFYERGLLSDQQAADSLKRECFIEPFVAIGIVGKVIVDRDEPATPGGERGRLLIPRALRKEKTLLPTTGHIIKAVVWDTVKGDYVSDDFLGRRCLFGQMSGEPIRFKNYPTWRVLNVDEIIGWVLKEDAQVQEQELEPMV